MAHDPKKQERGAPTVPNPGPGPGTAYPTQPTPAPAPGSQPVKAPTPPPNFEQPKRST